MNDHDTITVHGIAQREDGAWAVFCTRCMPTAPIGLSLTQDDAKAMSSIHQMAHTRDRARTRQLVTERIGDPDHARIEHSEYAQAWNDGVRDLWEAIHEDTR